MEGFQSAGTLFITRLMGAVTSGQNTAVLLCRLDPCQLSSLCCQSTVLALKFILGVSHSMESCQPHLGLAFVELKLDPTVSC